jgi:site-specific DNA recombinase
VIQKHGKRNTTIRCAVYTRVSTAEQADRDYSSLESQRETGEAYIASQKHAGWQCLPDRYDDGGFTGANVERPAFQRLLADIRAGKVTCVVCYKLDRLTRSLIDLAKTLEVFDAYGVALVSVTQAFDTSSATGKLMMHILMSFAEFERQLISERTRDKIAATRRRGKWAGGMPVLGYDVVDTKLVVNPEEAEQVRRIFEMYLERRSLTAVAAELDRRGWRTKNWTTKKGTHRGGKVFTKTNLHKLLTNPVYLGQVQHKGDVHVGEHEAILEDEIFQRVQRQLTANGSDGGRRVRNRYGALLKGLVHCKHCGCAMAHTYTAKANRRYRYYVCTAAQKQGWKRCPRPSLPATELERFVIDKIRHVGGTPSVVRETTEAVANMAATQVGQLRAEAATLKRKLIAQKSKLAQLASADLPSDIRLEQLAGVQEHTHRLRRRLGEIESELAHLDSRSLGPEEIAAALADFDGVWEKLQPRERAELVQLLVESVVWDAESEGVSVTIHSVE